MPGETLDVRDEFLEALRSNAMLFDIGLSDGVTERLADYYDLVREHNPILHLVAPSSPEEFATRHILESLAILEFLPPKARFADVGTGAGLPSIPCLIARADLSGALIESKEKKTGFLRAVVRQLQLSARTEIINRQFSEVPRPAVSHVTCRALDRFTQKLPQLLKWSADSTLLFFGGKLLGDELKKNGLHPIEKLMPLSDQRFLFVIQR